MTVCSPKPFAAVTGDGEDPPVDEDPELGLVIPLGKRPGVDGLPGGLIATAAAYDHTDHAQNHQASPCHCLL